MKNEYLSFQEIAEKTGYQRATVSYWLKQGHFKDGTVFKRGNIILVEKKEAERIIKKKITPIPVN